MRAPMKKVMVVCLMFVACGREAPQKPAPAVVRQSPAPVAPLPETRSEPDYGKAVQWMRNAPGYHFDVTIGDVKASGEIARPRAGEEKLRFRVNNDEWTAERRLTGVAWYRNGTHDTNEPPYADRIYQWMTFFPDPEKSAPQVIGSETIGGKECSHIRFTTLNTKETEDVWISRAGNHLVRLTTSGAGKAFPAVEMNIR